MKSLFSDYIDRCQGCGCYDVWKEKCTADECNLVIKYKHQKQVKKTADVQNKQER